LKSKILDNIRCLEIKDSSVWINEAIFGYENIYKYCDNLKAGNKVLEIGCGSGILLSLLVENFKNLHFEGIEPFNDGFSSLEILNTIIKDTGISIENKSYEEFKTNSKYNLIFCVNVFEHLEDWPNFLIRVKNLLENNGKLIILCPNYGFPYESHFRIPIIFNKKTTQYIFRNYIRNFEKLNNFDGLWKSLNFIKKKDVMNFVNKNIYLNNLKLKDDLNIIDFMILRILKDKEFRKRQIFVGIFALVMYKLGIIKFLKFFPNLIPYMKLEFKLMR
jgi:2-polyprenyl-3-methyl-5-hydroxy-6-metoxy-1,4-benzoquinol methylase